MGSKLLDTLKERPLLGDGAMGTQLQEAGLALKDISVEKP